MSGSVLERCFCEAVVWGIAVVGALGFRVQSLGGFMSCTGTG